MSARPLSILVADDNVDAANTLGQLLALGGHRVDVAFDGEQALRQAGEHLPDVAVLDLLMPRLDGVQVARHLRARGTPLRPLLLIALSGSVSDAVPQCHEIDAYFAKPVDFVRLERFIHEWSAQTSGCGCH
jgi:CheY-like chemotaxis protein